MPQSGPDEGLQEGQKENQEMGIEVQGHSRLTETHPYRHQAYGQTAQQVRQGSNSHQGGRVDQRQARRPQEDHQVPAEESDRSWSGSGQGRHD